jgi:chemotaxis protein CheC
MQLTDDQRDALTELMNIGVGRAGASLSELVGERVELYALRIRLCCLDVLEGYVRSDAPGFETVVFQDFTGELVGRAALAFPHDAALKFGQLLGRIHAVPTDRDVDVNGILIEVGNIVLNAVLGTIGNLSDSAFSCSVPELSTVEHIAVVMSAHAAAGALEDRSVILADAGFHVARRNVHGTIAVLFEMGGIASILDGLIAYAGGKQ